MSGDSIDSGLSGFKGSGLGRNNEIPRTAQTERNKTGG
jgi:hypothetical protein